MLILGNMINGPVNTHNLIPSRDCTDLKSKKTRYQLY